jgi:hypothetical protein
MSHHVRLYVFTNKCLNFCMPVTDRKPDSFVSSCNFISCSLIYFLVIDVPENSILSCLSSSACLYFPECVVQM